MKVISPTCSVGAAFLAAARVGVLAAAGLPNTPAGAGDGPSDSSDHNEPGAAGLGGTSPAGLGNRGPRGRHDS